MKHEFSFIIKSYVVYQKDHENPGGCPVFIFFSVNERGWSCGVVDMMSPVEFHGVWTIGRKVSVMGKHYHEIIFW